MKLLLISYEYPFNKQETFLANEVPYLVKAGIDVTVLPSRLFFRQDLPLLRALPDKAHLHCPKGMLAWKSIPNFLMGYFHFIHVTIRDSQWKLLSSLKIALNYLIIAPFKAGIIYAGICDYARKNQIDEIYAYVFCELCDAAIFYKENKQKSLIVISRTHGGDLYLDRSCGGFRPIREPFLTSLDHICLNSQDALTYFKKTYPSFRGAAHLCRLGVEKAIKLSKVSDDKVLRMVSCSNVIPLKRVHLIAEALTKIKFNIVWTHFGDGSELVRVREILEGCGSNIKASFPGRIPNDQVLRYYSENPIDLFVSASSAEGLPVSVMEAMAYGIPCAATLVGGTPEAVNGDNGIGLNPSITSEQLASVLTNFYQLPEGEKLLMRDKALSTWAEKFDAEKNFGLFANFLSDIKDT